jgi:lysophospholipase L1-like esterase
MPETPEPPFEPHEANPQAPHPFATDAAAPMDIRARRFRARDALITVLVAAFILVICFGPSIRRTGNDMDAGWQRDVVLAVGKPADAVADALPFRKWATSATAWISPDDQLDGPGSFNSVSSASTSNGVAAVPPTAFTPQQLGLPAAKPKPLTSLLVTGDSMSQPLDADLARRMADVGVKTTRDPHIGTGLSKSDLLDWGAQSVKQAAKDPDAVVIFIGANEGFPFKGPGGKAINCCGAEWAAQYATRARTMMNTYRRGGEAHVYWMLLPFPRDPDRQKIAKVVNAAIRVAAQPYAEDVTLVDFEQTFTPNDKYRVSMDVNGHDEVVRRSDGIHLNDAGAELAADIVEQKLRENFTFG